MRLTQVFDALQAADRPLYRTEIENATGLLKDEVYKCLIALARRRVLVKDGSERHRAKYSLVPGAQRPEDRRGQFERTATHRQLKATLRLAALGRACVVPQSNYSPARAPVQHAPVGRSNVQVTDACLLAQLWIVHRGRTT